MNFSIYKKKNSIVPIIENINVTQKNTPPNQPPKLKKRTKSKTTKKKRKQFQVQTIFD